MLFEGIGRYKKPLLAVLVVFILIITAFAGYQIYTTQMRQGKISVTVKLLPDDGTIVLNGSQTITPGITYLSPGTYSVKASKTGFEDFNGTLVVADNMPIFNIQLLASSDEAKKWVADHQSLYLESEKNGGETARAQSEAFQTENPIVANLPYKDPYYSIGYKSSDNKTIELTITAVSALYRHAALQRIYAWGYDPTNFKIIYTNYVSPLQ